MQPTSNTSKPGLEWEAHFAARTTLMRRSAIRELLKLAARPDIISFAGGLPAAELFPLARVKQALGAVLDRAGAKSLQYGETEGESGLRDWIARRFSRPGLPVTRENVLITSGAQQALDLVGRALLDPGDRVLVENPTYLALLSAWRPWEVEFTAAASDEEGVRVDAMLRPGSRPPKAVYLVPNFQNPRGTSLSVDRRRAVAAWSREAGVAVVEDDPYGELRYEGAPLPRLLELNGRADPAGHLASEVIYAGTFSKVLMPGLRVGWIVAARQVIDKLVQAKQAADLHTSTLNQHLVLELLSQGFEEEFVPLLRRAYRARRDRMLAAMERHFPSEARWTRPSGGMFLMARLPGALDAGAILPLALERGVAFVPGEEFHLGGEGRTTLRLNFTNADADRIEEGIRRLGALLQDQLDGKSRPEASPAARGDCVAV